MQRKRQTIRDHSAEANLFARRATVAFFIVVCMLGIVLNNLYSLQVEQYDDYQTRSNGNRIKVLPVAPNRGLIFDRNGVLLAENRPVFSLEITPEETNDLDDTLSRLSTLMAITDDERENFESKLKGQRRFKPIAIRTKLSEEDVALFSASKHLFPGVQIEARLARYYPYKETLTHLLGYVARINKKDLQKLVEAGQEANYAATHDIGKLGIEKYHEELLHGSVGYQQVEVNNQGRIIRVLNVDPPVPGKDIVLNIDIELQLAAQQALADQRGAVVVTDIKTGGVLALYSNPSYDPNLFVHGISRKNYAALLNSPDRPLINRATQGQYPPASTVKPHLALVGLEEGIITEDYTIMDGGRYQLPNVSHVWRDWKKWGHGKVNVSKAIEVSCDTYYYDLAYKLGIDKISEAMYEFGFGDFTGIDLYEESDANMPSRGWKRARFNQPWYIGDTIPVGIGQSFWTTTPIQLAHSLNTLVNRGERYIPQIIRGFKKADNSVDVLPLKTLRPLQFKQQENIDIVLNAMHDVVHGSEGTARSVFKDAPYQSAGKTGTAQLFSVGQDEKYDADKVDERLRDNAMYVGYAPFEAPEISVTVVLENAGGGSSNAAPVAREIMDFYFRDRVFDTDIAQVQP
ncbi:MAG TPA: penicillin-binding protein 2 [Alteromonas australica]|jgi:penicillin-binding protein 2|uniref:Peptidoglycan D,D-transpeptidase MrdA n=1 Tax=Alteromonas australica TaxID=589873 RepID=A0A353JMK8_9ALTE|nr:MULTISPECIES: penicillin-binding protein 2 [Alteromonas]MAO30019.1 penicillin-binding protein 2 [Alteromonas sp.]MBU33608.1 penicillin-binding protein 2 [Alteromonas sp.]QPL51634.1 penicillin-binding protein 2 [Alteromonas sp. B31-7]HAI71168.1 penicillin-binding protein 2 [Alteromonas australica]HAW75991.1 penicillin-binding protein 2 [Alteromonas australica]|tara:strand:- start:9825 stop:11714 length:1890 start_codon:yes stop_codon:yes gene_type:complete